MTGTPDAEDWDSLSEDETTVKRVTKSGNPNPPVAKRGIALLKKFYTKRTIFEGMNWIFYADTGDGKTWMINSASELGEVVIIDTEFRAQDTKLLEFPRRKFDVQVVEPVVMKVVTDADGKKKNVMNVAVTLNRVNEYITEFAELVDQGLIDTGTTIAIESMSDFWDEMQYEGKRNQAELAGKTIAELQNDGNVEWSDIKQQHKDLVVQLNALRSKGINIIYSARRNDTDSNAKTREIRSEKNLAFDTQNIVKLHTDMVDGQKVHYATFEKMLGKHCYETVTEPTFAKLDKFVRDRVAKQLAGEEL